MDRTTHAFTPEEVMAYLDGELSPERATEAAAHLEHCGECRAVAAELRGVSRQLSGWQVESAPDSLVESAVRGAAAPAPFPSTKGDNAAKGGEKKETRWLLPRGLVWWGSAFAVAALLLFAVGIPTLHRSSELAREAQRNAEKMAAKTGPAPIDQISALPPAGPEPRPANGRATMGPIKKNRDAKAGYAGSSAAAQESRTTNETAATALMMKDREAQAARADRNAIAPQAGSLGKLSASPASSGPMIIRNASLGLLTKEFDSARAAMENLMRTHQGYFGELNVAAPPNAGRSLTATLRVPAAQLDPVLVELRKLGKVEQENQSADDVTGQYVDLKARLANAQETEKRLGEILRERTGKVADVLDVEREISGVRQQIEQMEAQRKNMENQVQYASVDLRITEEYKQSLETPAPSLGTRIHNAAVDGFLGAADLVIGFLLFMLNAGPTLLLLAAMFAWPVWLGARWLRRRCGLAASTSQTA